MNNLKADEFQTKVLENSKPVLVDFFATWCGPCKMLAPILEQVVSESNGEFDVFKVDVDECQEIAKTYGIMSIPTMIVFKSGEVEEKMVGLRSKKDIVETMLNITAK